MTEAELRKKVVSIMTGWLGLRESNGSHKKILDIYNGHRPLARGYKVKTTDAWCAATVSAAFIKAGLTDIVPTECSCAQMIELYKKLGRWEENDAHVPSPGDVVLYDWNDNGKGDNRGNPDHVGIIVSVSKGSIRVIEGNKSGVVGYREIPVNGRFIRGYCLPDYAKKATTNTAATKNVKVSLPLLKNGSKGDAVRALQILLNGRGYSCGTVDGISGTKTVAAVKRFQKDRKLTQDGIVGEKTWAALLGV